MSGSQHLLAAALVLAACATRSAAAPPPDVASACQDAVLRNGFTIPNVQPVTAGTVVQLRLCGGAGAIEIPAAQIDRFEAREQVQRASAGPLAPAPAAPAPSAAVATSADSLGRLIAGAALRHRIDPDFVASVVRAESGNNPAAVSPKGARGLMQLMPQTAAGLGVPDPFDPAANLEGGTKYLRQLLDQYAGDAAKALSAYNAGPRRVDQYAGVPPFPETHAYVARIIEDYNRKKIEQRSPR
jgi:soluble lytic murein transglycosylase-like protein